MKIIASNHFGSVSDVARLIDHTLLKPSATKNEIHQVAEEGVAHHVAAVCVNPYWIKEVAHKMIGSGVAVCSVIGFPLGANRADLIAEEAIHAVDDGADEIDMVINLGLAKAGEWERVQRGIVLVRNSIGRKILKVILEICELTDAEIETGSQIAIAAGADFIKTSTGFGRFGATTSAVKIMRRIAGEKVGVKASGGIRTFESLLDMVNAGASRIGTSATPAILQQAQEYLREHKDKQ